MRAQRSLFSLGYTSLILAGAFLLTVGSVQATSIPGVVDVFVTTSAYSYTDTYNISNPILPTAGTNKQVYVNGRVTDGDGVGTGFDSGDLKSVELSFYREVMGSSCLQDLNNCYRVFCTVTANSQTVLNYSCAVDLSYLADPTSPDSPYASQVWNAEVIVTDDIDQVATLTKTFEISAIAALSSPETVEFGALAPGEETSSTTNVEFTLTQQGNTQVSAEIFGSAMVCTGNGQIPVENLKWSTIDVGASHASATSLSAQPVDMSLTIGTNDTGTVSQNIYLNAIVPLGVGGGCTGDLTVNAIAL